MGEFVPSSHSLIIVFAYDCVSPFGSKINNVIIYSKEGSWFPSPGCNSVYQNFFPNFEDRDNGNGMNTFLPLEVNFYDNFYIFLSYRIHYHYCVGTSYSTR